MRDKWFGFIVFVLFGFLLFVSGFMAITMANGGGGMDDPPVIPQNQKKDPEGIYATIEYRDDLIAADTFFMEVKAHPKARFPKITGGYAETNVHCLIKLRGVSVPRALQESGTRARPHTYVERERARFDGAMDYLWSLMKLNKVFKLHDPVVIGDRVECDVSVLLGGAWGSLGGSMINDEHARPLLQDVEWDWGSRNVTQTHPEIPK